MLLESLKEQPGMLFMCCYTLACHQNVVDIYESKIEPLTNSVHQALESLRVILKPKRHPKKFLQPDWGDYSCLRNIHNSHRNLVVSSDQVDLGKYLDARKAGREILTVGYRIPVQHRGIIETPVILARPPEPRGFWHHM